MPVPKKKHTRARSGRRRGPKELKVEGLIKCTSCKKLRKPHLPCPHCGFIKN